MGKKEDTSLMTQQHQTWQGGPKTKHKKQSVSVERRRSRFHSVPFLQQCAFRRSWTSHVLRSKSGAAVKIPSLLLPLGNYSLPADKLQVCCLSLPASNRWGRCVFWRDAILLVAALAKCMLPFKVVQKYRAAGEVHLFRLLPQTASSKSFSFLPHGKLVTCRKKLNLFRG